MQPIKCPKCGSEMYYMEAGGNQWFECICGYNSIQSDEAFGSEYDSYRLEVGIITFVITTATLLVIFYTNISPFIILHCFGVILLSILMGLLGAKIALFAYDQWLKRQSRL